MWIELGQIRHGGDKLQYLPRNASPPYIASVLMYVENTPPMTAPSHAGRGKIVIRNHAFLSFSRTSMQEGSDKHTHEAILHRFLSPPPSIEVATPQRATLPRGCSRKRTGARL